jgi:hypothetical protein
LFWGVGVGWGEWGGEVKQRRSGKVGGVYECPCSLSLRRYSGKGSRMSLSQVLGQYFV